MSKTLRTSLLTCAVALAAGCSVTGPESSAGQPAPDATQSSASPSAPAKTTAPVAKLTAACPLLSADELKALLGGSSSQTKVEAVEDKPDTSGGDPTYTCEYGSNGKFPFAMSVFGIQAIASFTAQDAIDAADKATHLTTHKVTGAGTAASFYTKSDGYSVITAAKRSHGQIRNVVFVAPTVVPQEKFIDVARVVIDRI